MMFYFKTANISEISVDVMVNSTNQWLYPEEITVNGAICVGGGPKIIDEMKKIYKEHGELQVGEVVYTLGYNLPCKYVIHTLSPVGPCNTERIISEGLANCYRNSLELAEKLNCESISFPVIGAGAFKIPLDIAIKNACNIFYKFKSEILKTINIICISDTIKNLYEKEFNIFETGRFGYKTGYYE